MQYLVPLLLAIVGSIVGRVLASLGLSVLTIKGVDIVIGQMKDSVVFAVNSLPGDVLAFFLMGGGGVALNLVFAAITFRLTYWGLTHVVRIVGVKV